MAPPARWWSWGCGPTSTAGRWPITGWGPADGGGGQGAHRGAGPGRAPGPGPGPGRPDAAGPAAGQRPPRRARPGGAAAAVLRPAVHLAGPPGGAAGHRGGA